MPSYAGAEAWRALGSGLENIGRLLSAKREEKRRREYEDFDLLQYAAERGGGAGPAPTIQTPGAMERLADQPPSTLTSPVEGVRMPTQSAPSVSVESRSDQRFIESPGARVHFKHPAVLEQEERDREANAARARQNERYAMLAPLKHVPEASARAMAYGDVPANVAMPPGGGTTDKGLPSVQQAYQILKDRYANFEDDGYGNLVFRGYSKPVEDIYAEAQDMARGRPMRATATPKPAPQEVVEEAGGPGFFKKLGQTIIPGGERGFLPPRTAVAEDSGKRTTDFQSAQRRARELQGEGKSPEEIIRIMKSEGYRVRL